MHKKEGKAEKKTRGKKQKKKYLRKIKKMGEKLGAGSKKKNY